jgi:protoporphyrinogen/coproporphyrinogen III oxidase
VRIAVVGGGIAGLAAARRLEGLLPGVELTLVESESRLGGKILTEHTAGFLVEGGPDSFLSRKARGPGLCEEVGLGDELVGRRPENARTFVRRHGRLHPLPAGLTGMVPTDLDALADNPLLSPEGRERLAAEVELAPARGGDDESVASFFMRRLGPEAYEYLVEPLTTGIYAGDGDRLSLAATFPGLRALELEHGSVIRGLLAQPAPSGGGLPPFVALRSGLGALVDAVVRVLGRTSVRTGAAAASLERGAAGYVLTLADGERIPADGIVLAVPAFAVAELLAGLDDDLADAHAGIPYASSALVTLGYRDEDVPRPLDGYGYVVPRAEGSDVLACSWTSSKWEGRAPAGSTLLRVHTGRFGGRDTSAEPDDELVALAREEVRLLDVTAEPSFVRIHRWPRSMPQYVLGHVEHVERIESALETHPGLAVAGAAYRGVGVPDCIASGEAAAESLARALAPVSR